MKQKNIVLTIIFFILLGIAYYTEEVYKKNIYVERQLKSQLIKNIDSLQVVKTPNYQLSKNLDSWIMNDYNWKTNKVRIDELVNILNELHVSSELKVKDDEEYFAQTKLSFELQLDETQETFTIGNVSHVSGAFYLKRSSRPGVVFICYDESIYKAPYTNQLDLDLKKYMRLISFLKTAPNIFLESNIFFATGMNQIHRISIDNIRNRKFELDLEKQKMTPIPPKNIGTKSLNLELLTLIKRISVKRVITKPAKLLSNLRSTIEVKGNRELTYKLYAAYGEQFGYFLKVSDSTEITELKLEKKSLFFSNQQIFWNKKIDFKHINFSTTDSFKFTVRKDNQKHIEFEVKDIKKFEVSTNHSDVSNISDIHFNVLFNLLFNLADFKEAKYIVDGYSQKHVYDLEVKLFDKVMLIKILPQKILVFDETNKQAFFFEYDKTQLPAGFFKQIFTVKRN